MLRGRLFFFLITVYISGYAQTNDLVYFEKGIDLVKNSHDFKEYSDGMTSRIQVMETQIPFKNLSGFFADTISSITGFDYVSLSVNDPKITNESLTTLSDKRRSKLKLFLSTIENDMFILEIAYARKKSYESYDRIFLFGPSLNYLFRIDQSEVQLVDSILMWNN